MSEHRAAILRGDEVIPLTLVYLEDDAHGHPVYEALGDSLRPGDIPMCDIDDYATVRFLGPVA
ncbi:hypothetical protein K8O93_00660 [Gordonia bronchialis]|uniref:hypothetical protein n=1 Tax=Gordonia bronchialis TaxID=2054 RepID=UPI001CBD4527|nr:hypothetical protein [Gordonia bronchialis]UAK38344.1 hypothetical protein K8O93_00660 [Gordonia bronchialis]